MKKVKKDVTICIVCGRQIKEIKYNFGLSCLKKACSLLKIENVKNLKGEDVLNNRIVKIYGKTSLNRIQKQLLTDRHLTLILLSEVDIKFYDSYKKLIKIDIEKIDKNTTQNDIKSFDIISLKEVFE